MRFSFFCCLFATGLVIPGRSGGAEPDAEALLAKAIQAHGGETALAKHKAVRLKLRARYEGATQFVYNHEWLFSAPNKYKDLGEGFALGRRVLTITATDGKDTWTHSSGQTQELEGKFAEGYKEQAHLMQVMRLVPLRGKEYQLSTVGETTVDGKKAFGLLVRTNGQKDITLYFDAQSSLLVKVERKVIGSSETEVKEERFLRDYPKKEAIPYARKVVVKHAGKPVEYYEIREVKFLEKADDREFRRR